MSKFTGFTDSETFTQLPDTFFHRLLNEIEDLAELKLTLYALWRVAHIEGTFRALRATDFDATALGLSADEITRGLGKCVQRGSLLKVTREAESLFFLNTPRGRASAEAFAKGQWRESSKILSAPVERPNIFKLYEENVGALTPLIADMLKEAEGLYRPEWVEEAFTIAVKYNKRNWKYIEAILKRWKDEGKNGKKDRQDAVKSSDKYTESEFSDFFKRDE
jgi:DnaD/phage-associated family protein